jgi:hypothetical protein
MEQLKHPGALNLEGNLAENFKELLVCVWNTIHDISDNSLEIEKGRYYKNSM